MGGMAMPPETMEVSLAESESFITDQLRRRRRRQAAEEIILGGGEDGSGGSGTGSGLGSGIILGESGSGIDGMDPAKMDEEELNTTDSKSGLLKKDDVLPVSTTSTKSFPFHF